MQERKNKRLLITLVVLTCALITVLFLGGNSTEKLDENLYAIPELRSVDRIVLKSAGDQVELSYGGSRWKVNGTNADRNLIEVLFATLQQVKLKRAVATSLQDSVVGHVKRHGVEVNLFSNGNLIKQFYAGGNTEKNQAFFVPPDGQEAHVVTIPGYRVYASGIFELPAIDWREKLIFDFSWRNFNDLKVNFRNPKGDFEVALIRNEAVIKGVAEADTAKLNTFLDELSLLVVEKYLTSRVSDSISKSAPLATFTIEDIANRKYSLEVFENQNQLLGRINNDQWAVLNERRTLGLLRPKEFFIKR